MNSIDAMSLIIVGLSALVGTVRGLTREVLGISSWIGAILLSYVALPHTQSFLEPFVTKKIFLAPISLVVTFVVSLMILSLICRSIARSVRSSALGGVDRSLGMVFGVVRGTLLLVLLYLTVSFFLSEARQPQVLKDSKAKVMIEFVADELRVLFPDAKILKKEAPKNHPSTTPDDQVSSSDDHSLDLEAQVKKMVHQQVQVQTAKALGIEEEKPATPTTPPHNKPSALSKLVDTLSHLQAQAKDKPTEKPGYTSSQRHDMERLANQGTAFPADQLPTNQPESTDQSSTDTQQPAQGQQ